MKKIFLIILATALAFPAVNAQDSKPWPEQKTSVKTFNSTRIINSHTVETLWGRSLDIVISHRFGDMATPGAARTFFGLDNASDIRIALEYGLSNRFNIGFGRSKGAGPQTQLLDGYLKYNLLKQTEDNSMPISLTLLGTSSFTMMERSTDSSSAVSFHEGVWTQRLSYCAQLIVARKFSERFSLQISPTYIHRNYVAFEDVNGLFAIGSAARLRLTKMFSLVGEYYYLFKHNRNVNGMVYRDPMALGFLFDTGGHTFQINLTNSAGLGETQFIPHTYSDVSKGEFRLGFSISRIVKF
jgi:hypothetical protein